MITKEEIEQAIKTAKQSLEPHKAIRDEALALFNQQEAVAFQPVQQLFEKYYDYHLKDGNGKTIKVGDILMNPLKPNKRYRVLNRFMQDLFVHLLWNPRVETKYKEHKPSKYFDADELQDMVIIDDEKKTTND